jgi:hypothetical protein
MGHKPLVAETLLSRALASALWRATAIQESLLGASSSEVAELLRRRVDLLRRLGRVDEARGLEARVGGG